MRTAVLSCALLAACSFEPRGSTGDAASGDQNDASGAVDAALPSDDAAQLACLETYPLEHGGHRYKVGDNLIWSDAELDCESEGGHLVVIDDEPENQFVRGAGPPTKWIGASDHIAEGTYLWVTGARVDDGLRGWNKGEPNDAGNREDCAEMQASGAWNDTECAVAKAYVCECDGAALASPETWCVTGTDDSCDICGDSCGEDSCGADQTCD